MIRGVLLIACIFAAVGVPAAAENPDYSAAEREHWSLQPRTRVAVPLGEADRHWLASPVDAFILRRLRERSLEPAAPADRRTLLRRITFDLTGLPPTPAEIRRFLDDTRPDAYERLVERLLASPAYGEQWGRHWLDVVRYAESEGFEYDRHLPHAWRYRDYVIDSFNRDRPFDEFVRQQLAGDELAPDDRASRAAVGFHRLGPIRRNAGNPEVALSRNEVLTEMTDTIGVAFLGLTLGCARCHDHMFDPIRQRDYYQFQAFLAGVEPVDLPLADALTQQAWQRKSDALNKRIDRLKQQLESRRDDADRLREQIEQLEGQLPQPLPSVMTVQNAAERTPIHLLARRPRSSPRQAGYARVGSVAGRGVCRAPAGQAGAANAVGEVDHDPDHPLTARVLVNRVWQYHFGTGLVSTPNDFGNNGSPPTHPELLDYLANRFIESGQSIKAIHRLIVLSSTYRQSSRVTGAEPAVQVDPSNSLLWRFPRRRLAAEEIRDSLLAVSGRLNRRMEGPSVIVPVDPELVELLYKPEQWDVTADPAEHDRRSIYLLAKRNLRLPFLEVFDQPTLQASCPRREASTHAPQALELLNGRLANELANALAHRLRTTCGDDSDRQIGDAFLLVAGRPPHPAERRLAREFLSSQPLEELALALFNLNDFLYVK